MIKQKNLLHLCSYYNTSSLYKNLIYNIKKNSNINQKIYIPLKLNDNSFEKNHSTVNKKTKDDLNLKHYYKFIFNKMDTIIYSKKINKYIINLEKDIEMNKIDFIHAHSLFVNGRVAYEMKKKYGIKYIVAVRSTDIDLFFKKLIHLRKIGLKIINDADQIIFISPSSKDKVLKYMPKDKKKLIEKKCTIVPNGIDDRWIYNTPSKTIKEVLPNNVKLYYLGALLKRKNVHKVISMVKSLNKKGYNIKLTIIGNGPYEENINKIIDVNSKFVNRMDWIKDKNNLLEIINAQDIFIMTSVNETFGLVYIEAMSQGKPIIYTKNDGIYNYFKEGEVGYAIDPYNINELERSIIDICNDYENISDNCIIKSKEFNWNDISIKYINLYNL